MSRYRTIYRPVFQQQICFVLLVIFCAASCTGGEETARIREDFNKDWKFFRGDDSLATRPGYDDSGWRPLDLPHDWSIEGSFDQEHPAGTAGGALPTGTAWYRKTFHLPEASEDKSIYIDFDGIYRNSEVWINGHYLGKRPNGYVSFRYELGPYLHFGEKANTIAVRVDNSAQPASRWYTGSGIYRNVWLVSTGKVHVDHWGAFLTTPTISVSAATAALGISLRNATGSPAEVRVETTIYDREGRKAGFAETPGVLLEGSSGSVRQELSVQDPALWSVENPYLYRAVTRVYLDGELSDCYETPFGIRYFNFDAETGFSLNGKPLKILGVCMHHDLGALGAAVNTRAIERQLELLKEMGCNAIRTAHNPPAPELLDLCDRMGFLVMDESFDVWKKKKKDADAHLFWDEWHRADLSAMVRRDRNHPSIFCWSIGNEIREQFDSTGLSITRELAEIVREIDPTRPVTSALTENHPEKNFIYQSGALDLLGFNYKHRDYAALPERFPGEKFIAAETTSGLASRGHYDRPPDTPVHWPPAYRAPFDGNPDLTVSAYDRVSAFWGATHEETWKEVKKLDHMAGLFVWTGFDYLGEPAPYPWPARSSYFGIIDLAGFPKDVYYLYKSEWSKEPVLHILPHWNWEKGDTVDVWAYYNQADEVALYLNGDSLGTRRKQGDELHVEWRVPYAPGVLKAVSRKGGKPVLEREVRTAGPAARISLEADRDRIRADGRDLSFITVRITDENGRLVPRAANSVRFSVRGPGVLAAVDNGYQASLESFQADSRKAFNGMCLAIVRSEETKGKVVLTARSPGLEADSVTVWVD